MEKARVKLLKMFIIPLLSCSAAFGWYAEVTTDRDVYSDDTAMRIGLFICNEAVMPVNIRPIGTNITTDVIVGQSADANTNVKPVFIGTARLTKLSPGPGIMEKAILLPLFTNGPIPARSKGLLSNCYVRLLEPNLPEPNDLVDPNTIMDDEIAPTAPEFFVVPGDYVLSCAITDSTGIKAVGQKIIRVVRARPTDINRCLKIEQENNRLIKQIDKKTDNMAEIDKQTLKNTAAHTILLNRIIQLVTKK